MNTTPTTCPVCDGPYFAWLDVPTGGRSVDIVSEDESVCVSLEYSALIEHGV